MTGRTLFLGTIFDPNVFVGQKLSIDFDGSTEFMACDTQTSAPRIGIDGDFTASIWFKPSALPVTGSGGLLSVTGANPSGKFHLAHTGTTGIQWLVQSGTGSTRANITWTDLLTGSENIWRHVVMVYDSPGNGVDQRILYFDGVNEGEGDILSTNNTANTSDSQDRAVFLGASSPIAGVFEGRIASVAFWDALLTSDEITAIYNSGSIDFNLNKDSGNYVSSADLVHWWELGRQASPNLGADSATPTNPLDLEEAATDITDADRVNDAPSL